MLCHLRLYTCYTPPNYVYSKKLPFVSTAYTQYCQDMLERHFPSGLS